MIKYNIIRAVLDYSNNTYEGDLYASYLTEEEARRHLPSVEDIKYEMSKEIEQGARYKKTTAFEYVLEKEDDEDDSWDLKSREEIDRHIVYFYELN